ncbi:MAG TPA: alpha/beta fold hydrolase [Verrucomicrobiae bacterium]|nr:alpha/beta fold hydrolase [Verrucomicrobiae bacterium]
MTRIFIAIFCAATCFAQTDKNPAKLFLDFEASAPQVELMNGAVHTNGVLRFTHHLQYAQLTNSISLDGLKSISIGGWFYPHRYGEQYFFFRGLPEIDEWGRRFFRPQTDWVNFVLGTDQRGFFLATANGNSFMPFPHVTVNELTINTWHQLVYTKDERGFQKFYVDGALVHTDTNRVAAGKFNAFRDTKLGEPIRLALPLGGDIGEAWIFPHEISAEEVGADFAAKRMKYKPAFPAPRVLLRDMTPNPAAYLWKETPTKSNWRAQRNRITAAAFKILGSFPTNKVALKPEQIAETDCGSYIRKKLSIQVQEGDRMPFYLLVPKKVKRRAPVIICWYGTSGGAGKDSTVGISGRDPGSKPHANIGFAVDLAEAGFIAVAPDWLRDGERIKPGRRPYDTTGFYNQFPDWSLHGKDSWDTSRLIDYLQTLKIVDGKRVGLVGHSYGGHSTIFTTAFEPRIKAAVANGPVSDFIQHGAHWGVPKGAGNSQSLPNFRPYVLDRTIPPPITFYEFTSLIAPRPLLVGQAAGEARPMEEENASAVSQVYRALGASEKVRYVWYAGDHDFPPEMRRAAVEWFQKWLR